MKNIIVIQDGIKECGSACLLSIIRYYGGNISISKLLEMTNTGKEGTNFYDLTVAANEIGLSAKAYHVDHIDKIYPIQKPFISQVIIENYKHFVVVYKMHKGIITIMDPAKGMVKMSNKAFDDIWTGYILILEPYKQLPIYQENKFISNIIITIFMNNKKMITNIISLTIISIILTCIYTYYFKMIIDNYVSTNELSILIITIIFIIIFTIKIIATYLRNILLFYLNQKIDLSIITSTIDKIIHLPYSYYKNKTTGEMVARINDLTYLKNIISKIITTIILDILLVISVLIILFILNWQMTIMLLIITIIYLLVFIIYRSSIKKATNEIQVNSAKISSLLVESLNSYSTIKGLALEEKFIDKINKKYLDMIKSNFNLNNIINNENLIKDLFEGIITILIIYLGITFVMDKSLSLGSLITYNTLIFYFLTPVRNMFDFYKEYYYVKNSFKRINNLMEFKYDKLDKMSTIPFSNDIHIKNLTFSYNLKDIILKNISFDIEGGEKVLLLGNSGSGKSTLLKLLYRYYDSPRNKIFIGNYDIVDYQLLDVRKYITYLSQNEWLYTDTIRNNIILERNISDIDFLNVCKLTEITDIIKDNSLGYNMPLEENGVNISGGQRQRIILARTLLKESKVILIDEGLNEIDIDLERKILKNIFNYYQEKTFIIISHRLDNIDLFDRVINLENGSIRKDLIRYEWNRYVFIF